MKTIKLSDWRLKKCDEKKFNVPAVRIPKNRLTINGKEYIYACDISEATHWLPRVRCNPQAKDPCFAVNVKTLYKLFEMPDSGWEEISPEIDNEYFLVDDDGNASLAYLCVPGYFIAVENERVEFLEEKEFLSMTEAEAKAAFQIPIQAPHLKGIRQKQFDIRQFIIKNLPERTRQEIFTDLPIAQRVFMKDGSEEIVWYDLATDIVKNINIGKPPIIKCRACGFEFTRENKRCNCKEEDSLYVNIYPTYSMKDVSGNIANLEVIRDIGAEVK
jgi:hypothetical protein